MHAAGIQFYHAFLVRQPAQANAVIVRIILRTGHDQDRRVKRVAAFGQVFVGAVQIGEPVVGTYEDGTLSGSRAGLFSPRSGVDRTFLSRVQSVSVQAERQRAERGRGQKITTGKTHASSRDAKCGLLRRSPAYQLL